MLATRKKTLQIEKIIQFDKKVLGKRYDVFTKVMDPSKDAPCNKIADEFVIGQLMKRVNSEVVRFKKWRGVNNGHIFLDHYYRPM